jgi:hypothetical protein
VWFDITFLNKAGVTLSCRGSKKILAHDTWKSLEFNLDVGSITLCLVPQLFMLELMATWYLPATTSEGSTFLFFIFLVCCTFLFFIFLICCMLGEAKVPSQCWLRMLWRICQNLWRMLYNALRSHERHLTPKHPRLH